MGSSLLVAFAALMLGATAPDDEERLKVLRLQVQELQLQEQAAVNDMVDLLRGRKHGERTAEDKARLSTLERTVAKIAESKARKVAQTRALEEVLREKRGKDEDLEDLVRKLLERMERTEVAVREMQEKLDQGFFQVQRYREQTAYEALRRAGEARWRVLEEPPPALALPDGRVLVGREDGGIVWWDPVQKKQVDPAILERTGGEAGPRFPRTPEEALGLEPGTLPSPGGEEVLLAFLRGRRLSFSFEEVPLDDAVGFLQKVSGLEIRLSSEVDAGKTEVNLKATDIPLGNALDLITEGADLGYLLKGRVIYIIGPRERERREAMEEDRELEARARDLARRLEDERSAEEREELREVLLDVLRRGFDLRIDLREAEIHDLEEKVDSLREEFERRVSQKERLIQRRFEDLTGKGRDPW